MTVDPFEGLPPHMVESIPVTVVVTILRGPGAVFVGGERKIALDAPPVATQHTVQLERDGAPLTRGERPGGWTTGERDGWREWPGPKWEPPRGTPRWDTWTVDDVEEIHD